MSHRWRGGALSHPGGADLCKEVEGLQEGPELGHSFGDSDAGQPALRSRAGGPDGAFLSTRCGGRKCQRCGPHPPRPPGLPPSQVRRGNQNKGSQQRTSQVMTSVLWQRWSYSHTFIKSHPPYTLRWAKVTAGKLDSKPPRGRSLESLLSGRNALKQVTAWKPGGAGGSAGGASGSAPSP